MNSLYPNLVSRMRERNVSDEDIAALLGERAETVNLKFRGLIDWTLREAIIIGQFLNDTDLLRLFLSS